MAELQNAVNELIKGKKIEENLHVYTEGLSSLYKKMALIRMSMNYFTFAEIFLELDAETKKVIEPSVDKIQKLVNDVILLEEKSDETINVIEEFRNELIGKMEVLTAYTDKFQIIEYLLNRVEFRFKDSGFNNAYYNDKFEKDIFKYITSEKDNSVINMKLSQVVAQLPMRLSKNKFYDMLKDSLSLYKGSEKQSVKDFSYMIKTAGTLYIPDDFEKYFPRLKANYELLNAINIDNIEEEQFIEYRRKLDESTALIEQYSDFYVMITEVLNDVYSVVLNNNSLTDKNEKDKVIDIISKSYDLIEGHDISANEISEKFVEFEGLQERISNQIFNPESALEEIISINKDYISGKEIETTLNNLIKSSKLQSTSTFATLNTEDSDLDLADEQFITETVDGLVKDFSDLFDKCDRYYKRAVMAMVISTLPTFFNNLEEFKKYVHVALSQCNDMAEKQACMSLINMMITGE